MRIEASLSLIIVLADTGDCLEFGLLMTDYYVFFFPVFLSFFLFVFVFVLFLLVSLTCFKDVLL